MLTASRSMGVGQLICGGCGEMLLLEIISRQKELGNPYLPQGLILCWLSDYLCLMLQYTRLRERARSRIQVSKNLNAIV